MGGVEDGRLDQHDSSGRKFPAALDEARHEFGERSLVSRVFLQIDEKDPAVLQLFEQLALVPRVGSVSSRQWLTQRNRLSCVGMMARQTASVVGTRCEYKATGSSVSR